MGLIQLQLFLSQLTDSMSLWLTTHLIGYVWLKISQEPEEI